MKKGLLLATLVAVALTACKPTEHNYQNAYEKAHQAAERKAQDRLTASDGTMLEDMNAPRTEVVDGETLYIASWRVKAFETEIPAEGGDFAVAVARYTMPTNARRHAGELKEKFEGTFIATDGEDNYYVVVGRGASAAGALPLLRQFAGAFPGFGYPGLSGHPLLLPLSH